MKLLKFLTILLFVSNTFLYAAAVFTEDEQLWIDTHPIIEYTGDPNWLPFEANKDGKHIGIAADYVHEVAKLTGLEFKYNPSESWTEATEKVKEKRVLMLVETTDSKLDLQFTQAFFSNYVVMVMRDDTHYVDDLNTLSDKKIAIIKDYGYVSQIKRDFKDLKFYVVDDIHDGLAAVSTGKYDVLLCTFALGSYTISEMGLHNIKIVGKTHILTELGFGIVKENETLIKILNKALSAIDQKKRNEISYKWVHSEYVEKIDYTIIWEVLIISMSIILAVMYWNKRLRVEIEKRKKIENSLTKSESLFKDAQELAKIGSWELGLMDDVLIWSDEVFRIFDIDPNTGVSYDTFVERIHPEDRTLVENAYANSIKNHTNYGIEHRLLMPDGTIKYVRELGKTIYDGGTPIVSMGTVQDITERKKMEEVIHQYAFYDMLTQLPNRRLLTDRLLHMQAVSKRSGKYGAVLFLDLDNFKPLNDTYGHAVGDLLLIEVSRRLNECIRESDTVSRFGGDEFVVLLSELSSDKDESDDESRVIAEKIRSTLAQPYSLPVRSEGDEKKVVEYRCTSSIGVTLFHSHEAEEDEIIKRADSAMYVAKEAGGDNIKFFDE